MSNVCGKIFSPFLFARVAVPVPAAGTGVLTYRVTERFRDRVIPGTCVVVPVSSRKITGIVVSLDDDPARADQGKIKDILDIVAEDIVFPHDLMQLSHWASRYYLVALGEMMGCLLPKSFRYKDETIVKLKKPRGERKAKQKIENLEGRINQGAKSESGQPIQVLSLTATEEEILTFLKAKPRVTTKRLEQQFSAGAVHKALPRLTTIGLIEVTESHPRKRRGLAAPRPRATEAFPPDDVPQQLSPAQEYARGQIIAAAQSATFRIFLLHGVTGSGKTEVYLQAAREVIERGRTVLMLVPEIALTHQLTARVRARFGERVAVLHSGMAGGERAEEWRRIAYGETSIVVGVRSAVFAPLPRLGLIVVDEEHDASYKQEEGPRYNARDLAVLRGQLASCPVVLGSATPSLESYFHSHSRRYTLTELPERVESRPLPTVDVVDLRQERQAGNPDRVFSVILREALVANHLAGHQSLLFLNRRGYANYLQCQLCGEVLHCTRCSVSLTFHLKGRTLRCHYCGFAQAATDVCPSCHEAALEGAGAGTEQIEEALRRFLPGVRVARLDRDSVSHRGALDRVLRAWRAHELDVLIGTQMVAKGHDVPGVTLVGVLLADASLNFPDFRSSERTFQVLTQVAGRAGRGEQPGRVIIQTYSPHHYAVRCAARHDFARFATQELRYRRRLGYPPFTRLVNIRIEGKEKGKVEAAAERLAERLRRNLEAMSGKIPTLLGPAPAPLERLQGRERWQILLKGEDRHLLHALVRKTQEEEPRLHRGADLRIIVDVDPYNML